MLPKDFIFTRIQCTCSPSHKQYSVVYFGTTSCWNITLSCVLSAHSTPRAKQYSLKYLGTNSYRNISLSCVLSGYTVLPQKAKQYFIFICFNCTYYPKAKPIFPEIFRHQQLPKYSIFMNNIPPEYFGTNCCQKISFSHGFNAYVPRATSNIPHSILVPRATEILHCHVY